MEHDQATTTPGQVRPQGEVVELRGGGIWELTTTSGERVVVDRGFRPRGGDIRNRWRRVADEPWRRLFGVRPIDVEIPEPYSVKRWAHVAIGARVEISTGFRDIWRTEAPLVAVRELEEP
ncbi:hypothetical protein [Leucobacter chromiiresistens]|uniref:Uncharacterized protein n=1 Tax=Leucobacter chromiiresistens TaxID=1079994 RepID=A0A147ENM5_9MICO|nr:hypothetical protein [Leucobacter chromiiresistens]KTR86129.1 hypothetical protein NS354_06460 [Leucobacter chromiiresistens]